MKRYCLALDLKDDARLIEEYERYHKHIWPEITESIKSAGITSMQIYRLGNRLFMIMETDDLFSFEGKVASDKQNPRVQEWESLMWNYQQPIAGSQPGEKWRIMDLIFDLDVNG